jgi:hypothetical protein
MRWILVLIAFLLAGCGTPSDLARAPSILIDQPTAPFPYNSQFCP